MTQPSERREAFDATEDLLLPDVADLTGPGGRVQTEQQRWEDVYHDTASGALGAAGAELYRTRAGLTPGWRLRLPAGTSPAELTSRARTRTAPAALARAVLGLTRSEPLHPVAEITTHRTTTRLVGADGRRWAAVHDDRLTSTSLRDDGRLDHWRQLSVVPGEDGDDTLLGTLTRLLHDAGARSTVPSRALVRALALPAALEPPEPSTLADLLGRYVAEQCDTIVRGDLALRLGEPQVHPTRVAIRRLRSTLRVFGDLLDPGPTRRLEDDLVWWAGLLGEVRDREVLAERLRTQLAALPPALVVGPVATDVATNLGRERARHLRRLEAELAGPRLLDLLGALARWRAEPPFLEGAAAPADAVRPAVKDAGRKARRRLRDARRTTDEIEQTEQLHRARKAAKRARYAAELARPAWPGAARRVKSATHLQRVLGEHQDSVVAIAYLQQRGAAAGRGGFTYGLLLGAERERAARLRADLDDGPQ